MENLESLDQSSLQNLLGNGGGSLIPESLITTITVSFIALNVIGVLFLIVYILGLIRKWKVQSAVFNMQKDLAEIKTRLSLESVSQKTQQPASTNSTPTTDSLTQS